MHAWGEERAAVVFSLARRNGAVAVRTLVGEDGDAVARLMVGEDHAVMRLLVR